MLKFKMFSPVTEDDVNYWLTNNDVKLLYIQYFGQHYPNLSTLVIFYQDNKIGKLPPDSFGESFF